MVSSLTAEGADATLEALRLGAVDFVPKPTARSRCTWTCSGRCCGQGPRGGRRQAEGEPAPAGAGAASLRAKRISAPSAVAAPAEAPVAGRGRRVVVVGTSTGGPPALEACWRVAGELSLADPGRPAHAGDFHRPAGAPPRRPLHDRRDGGAAPDGAGARARLYRPRRRRPYHLADRRRAGRHAAPGRCPPIHGIRAPTAWCAARSSMFRRSLLIGVLMTGMGDDGARP